jgi:hypothetical protein
MAAWLVYGSVVGSATNRIISVHWLASHHLWQGLYAVSAWVSPDILPPLFRLVVWLVLLVGLAWLILKRQFAPKNKQTNLPDFFKLLLLGIVIYCTQIVLSISFLDVQVRLSPRILSPVYLSLMMTLLYGVSGWWPTATVNGRRVLMAVGGVMCLAYLSSALYTFSDIRQLGEHYTSVAWHDSETIAYLQTVDGRTPYVTNGPDFIYYYTGLPVTDIPAEYQDTSLLPNEHYEEEMALLAKEKQAGSQLVYFHDMQWRWFLPTQKTLSNRNAGRGTEIGCGCRTRRSCSFRRVCMDSSPMPWRLCGG